MTTRPTPADDSTSEVSCAFGSAEPLAGTFPPPSVDDGVGLPASVPSVADGSCEPLAAGAAEVPGVPGVAPGGGVTTGGRGVAPGGSVGVAVGRGVGLAVGLGVGRGVGRAVGTGVGTGVGVGCGETTRVPMFSTGSFWLEASARKLTVYVSVASNVVIL